MHWVWIWFRRFGKDKDMVFDLKEFMIDWLTIWKAILKRYAKTMQKEMGDEFL